MAANGRGKRRLVVGGMPAWSPNGRELAYVVERRIPARRLITENELRVIGLDGRRSTRLTSPTRDRVIRDPAWSPDAKQLAVRRDGDLDDSDGLVVMDADGSDERVVVPVGYWEYAGHPAWSPAGETIVFDESAAIHAVDLSGANRRVLRIGDRDSDPTWSPDRRSIAFYRTAAYSSLAGGFVSEERGLHVVSSNGRTLRRIRAVGYGDAGDGEMPTWSPNGRWIAYGYGNAGIALHDLRTDRGRVLVCERAPGNECDGRGVYAPAWLPTSKEVLYWGTLDSDPMSLSSRKVSGRPGRFLRDSPCTGDQPWSRVAADASPDGRWLLITALRKIKFESGDAYEPEVWRIPLRGCGGRFTSRPGGARGRKLADGSDAVWSPDGTRVAFVKRVGGDDEIYVMRSDGSRERALTANTWDDEQPDW